MQSSAEPLSRRQYLVSSEHLRKIEGIAKQSACSAAEVVRRAIEAYDPDRDEETLLDAMLDSMHENVKEALESTRQANRVVAATIAKLETGPHGDN